MSLPAIEASRAPPSPRMFRRFLPLRVVRNYGLFLIPTCKCYGVAGHLFFSPYGQATVDDGSTACARFLDPSALLPLARRLAFEHQFFDFGRAGIRKPQLLTLDGKPA